MFGDDHAKDDTAAKSADDLAGAVQAMSSNGAGDPGTSFAPDPAAPASADTPVTPPANTPDVITQPPASAPPDLVPTPVETTAAPAVEATEPAVEVATEAPATAAEPTSPTPASTDAVLASPLTPAKTPSALAPADSENLLDVKQQALEQLKPLVDHLDNVPEEKFDALMMMIRASDDQSLIQPAYEAAQKITDDTKRAEALLDVVNEINYLTSNQQ